MQLAEFRRKLSLLFDDNIKTVVWKNYMDYAIWSLIALSTIEIFLSTYPGVVERFGAILYAIDIFTTIFFTIEVTLRIWTADLIDPKFSGFWGRVRYCLTFYGFIDFISTYPFYLSLFVPVPYTMLKVFRIARLLRVFRFMRSFRLLTAAFRSKSKELMVSLQFLVIVTVILSFVLFFVENDAQPDVYADGLTPVIWSFMQYIGDPGGFAECPPVTLVGRIIACIIGIIGIAIFAVPAGLIGSGFTECMEKEERAEKVQNYQQKIRKSFKHIQCRYTKLLYVPKFVSLTDIKSKMFVNENDIIEAVATAPDLRLRNLATARPIDERPEDRLVVECFPRNTPYGCFIDRGSKITIVTTSNQSEAAIGTFAFFLAKIGGFNYISKEVLPETGEAVSYYNMRDDAYCPNKQLFLDDIEKLSAREGSWVICLLSASGGMEPVYPTLFHYIIGGKKGEVNYADPNLTIKDVDSFRAMYEDLSQQYVSDYNWESDIQRFHTGTGKFNIARRLKNASNIFTIRIAWSITCFDYHSVEVSLKMAKAFSKHLLGRELTDEDLPTDMKSRTVDSDYAYLFYPEIVQESNDESEQ